MVVIDRQVTLNFDVTRGTNVNGMVYYQQLVHRAYLLREFLGVPAMQISVLVLLQQLSQWEIKLRGVRQVSLYAVYQHLVFAKE